jgi:hypothetical protein
MRLRVRRRIRPHHRLRDRSSPLTLGEPYPELRGSEGSGLSIALILGPIQAEVQAEAQAAVALLAWVAWVMRGECDLGSRT